MINVFGHTHPDSDAVCTAVVTAFWLQSLGRPARAWRLGEINRETRFIFRASGLPLPDLLTSLENDAPVWLVDFTEPSQGPNFLHNCNIVGVIDHHRLGGLITQFPPEVWIRPVGSSATLLWSLMGRPIRNHLTAGHAVLLLGALLSDTIALKSPTTTNDDRRAAEELSEHAGIDLNEFSRQLLAAKTDIAGLNAEELLEKDLKAFVIAGTDVRIAQLEVASIDQLAELRSALNKAIADMARRTGAGLVVLMVTDIVKSFSTLYFAGNAIQESGPCSIPGMLSRKKQLLPWLDARLKKSRGES
ncbi:TPA: manganese-dependent inorganic pyrophosphatase [Klebsiella pneumoniae]